MDVRVRITPGMPEVLAGAVLMHEYGHVLMRVDPRSLAPWPKPRQLAHDEEEGACEVLAAEWLVRQTSSHAARELRRLVENKDPVYGDGYRKMKQRRAQYHDVSEWVNAELLGQRSSKVKQSRIK